MKKLTHDLIERSPVLLLVLALATVSVGGLVEIVPLFFQHSLTKPVDAEGNQLDIQPYDALSLAGRDIYIREGCVGCHSQMIRPFRAETERYGHFSVAAESMYDRPFLWGSKRTGPDLARVGGRYTDEWHRVHLMNPRDVMPESNMPAFPWLDRPLKDQHIEQKMIVLRRLGHPYTDADIAGAKQELEGVTEMEAIIAYLQGLGTTLSNFE